MAAKNVFLLGDTAWMLYKGTNQEIDDYLTFRAGQGYDMINIACCTRVGVEFQGINRDGVYPTGASYVNGEDAWTTVGEARFYEPFMQVIDYIINKAAELKLYVMFVPIWGEDFWQKVGTTASASTLAIAGALGTWIGTRYKDKANIVWGGLGEWAYPYTGGSQTQDMEDLANAYMNALEAAAPQLKTMHPDGGVSSADTFSGQSWHDFNSLQTFNISQSTQFDLATDYARTPARPCIDLEPAYEESPRDANPVKICDDYYLRYEGYHQVMQGAAGHVFGNLFIYQCGDCTVGTWSYGWDQALCEANGGTWNPGEWVDHIDRPIFDQAVFMKALMESRWLGHSPQQSLITSTNPQYYGTTADTDKQPNGMLRACLAPGLRGAMIYWPKSNLTHTINLALITGASGPINAWWYNVRDGLCYNQSNVAVNTPARPGLSKVSTSFTSPNDTSGSGVDKNDWVLVLDDAGDPSLPVPGTAHILG